MQILNELKERWLNICLQAGHKGFDIWLLFDDLVARYSEPWRAYHTLDHILAMFREMDQIYYIIYHNRISEVALKLAIWYHDAVYDPKRSDNEDKSVELFRAHAVHFSLDRMISHRDIENDVCRMILASKHKAVSANNDSRLFCDIDLSILGQSETIFDEYESRIRREYEWVAEPDYIKGRSGVLRSFLDRQNIYSTVHFQEKYEKQARQNIARSIEKLSRRL